MYTVGDWVALVCFVSLALLGWVVLVYGFTWPVAAAGLWWLIIGGMVAAAAATGKQNRRG